jgi:hypothetical protein
MDFPYYCIAVYRAPDETVPVLNELANPKTRYYCSLKMKLIQNVLIKDLLKTVMDYMGEDKMVHYFSSQWKIQDVQDLEKFKTYNPEVLNAAQAMKVEIQSRAQKRLAERQLMTRIQKEKAMDQQMDILVTDAYTLDSISDWVLSNRKYFIKHIHIISRYEVEPRYRASLDLAVLPMNSIWQSEYIAIAEKWKVGSINLFGSYNSKNDLVIDLRDRKMYYQKPTKHKTKYLEFKSWSWVYLPLK